MVRAGLRAELAPANLFPGGLAVLLEMRPEADPVEQKPSDAGLPQIPTTGMPLEPLTAKIERLATRISALPLEQTVARLNGLIDAATQLAKNPALTQLLSNLAESSESFVPAAKQLDPVLSDIRATGSQAREIMAETQTLIEASQPLAVDLTCTLEQIGETARSMRLLAEMFERQPEAVLRGKSH
jgi:paraquat-inducible protein B